MGFSVETLGLPGWFVLWIPTLLPVTKDHYSSFQSDRNIEEAQLQITGGTEDNSKIILFISQQKHVLWPSLELSQWDSSNDGSQFMFFGSQVMILWRNMANYPKIIPVTLSSLEHWESSNSTFSILTTLARFKKSQRFQHLLRVPVKAERQNSIFHSHICMYEYHNFKFWDKYKYV